MCMADDPLSVHAANAGAVQCAMHHGTAVATVPRRRAVSDYVPTTRYVTYSKDTVSTR